MDRAGNPSLAAPPRVAPGAHRQRSVVRLQQHLSHRLLLYAMSAIAAGLAVGYPLRAWTSAHTGGMPDPPLPRRTPHARAALAQP